MPSIDEMINTILRHEGGFVNDPDDRGGATNFGITQVTLSKYIERAATIEDVRNLDIETARDIYELRYYRMPKIDKLPKGIQEFIFDCAVNHGPRRAIKFVQIICNEAGFGPLATDGLMGPKTKMVADKCWAHMGLWMLTALIEERLTFYANIVARDESQEKFLLGWTNRAKSFLPDENHLS